MPTTTRTPLDCVLAYASRGWQVFPLAPRDKVPMKDTHGFKDATANAVTIRKWWTRWPDANIGIRTGEVSNLVVIDIDPRNGGHLTWADLESEHDRLDTAEVFTGSGGRHLYFNHAFIAAKGNDALGPGIDIKSNGGYVVAPPSIHPNGRAYEWEASEQEPADLPSWVVTYQTEVAPTSRDLPKSNISPWEIPDGVANDQRFRGFDADRACAYALELKAQADQLSSTRQGSSPFICLLHDESHPSAWLFIGEGGDILYHCEHKGEYNLTLPQVRASLAYKEITRFKDAKGKGQRGEHVAWRLRLLYEAGVLKPLPVKHCPMWVDAKPACKAVYEGFILLLGLKEHLWPGDAAAFTWRFARAWCGVTEHQAKEASKWLMEQGFFRVVGRYRGVGGNAGNVLQPGKPRDVIIPVEALAGVVTSINVEDIDDKLCGVDSRESEASGVLSAGSQRA